MARSEVVTDKPSSRRAELLDASYAYVLGHGLNDLSLRPLAAAIGSSPRVLLYLFGSKENLLREVLTRARSEQITRLTSTFKVPNQGLEVTAGHLWAWLSAPEQRAMVRLTYEAFILSLRHEPGPWTGFAAEAAQDWLNVLIDAQVHVTQVKAEARATRVLATIRGLLIDLLACGDNDRIAAAARMDWL